MPVQRIIPTANGYSNAWPVVSGAATHWQALTSDDGAASYVEMSGGGAGAAEFCVMGPDIVAASVASITLGAKGSMTVNAQTPGDSEAALFYVRTVPGGNAASCATDSLVSPATSGYTLITGVSNRPGGGAAWIPSDLPSIQAGASFPHGATFSEYRLSHLYLDVDFLPPAGGFACLVGSVVGAALGLVEMANLARDVYRRTRIRIRPAEYQAAWLDIRGHRWPKTFEVAR